MSGDTVVVGAYSEDTGASDGGAVYVFYKDSGGVDNWGEVSIQYSSDVEANDFFGWSTSVSGDTLVVGAHREDTGGSSSGSAYIFSKNSGGIDNWGEVKILRASIADAGDYFGFSTSISGSRVVVGAHRDDTGAPDGGAACVFNLPIGEICDDDNTNSDDGCSGDCYSIAACGDGNLDNVSPATEECDDGDTVGGDGCASNCTSEVPIVCGDGMKAGAEVCDDGNTADNDGCSGNCSSNAVCGDGNLDNVSPATEECDDDNIVDGDGCSLLCIIESGGSAPSPADTCDGILVGAMCASMVVVVAVSGGCGLLVVIVGAVVVVVKGGKKKSKRGDGGSQSSSKPRRPSVLSVTPTSNPDGLGANDLAFLDVLAPRRPKSIESGMTVASGASTATGEVRKRAIAAMIDALDIDELDQSDSSLESTAASTSGYGSSLSREAAAMKEASMMTVEEKRALAMKVLQEAENQERKQE